MKKRKINKSEKPYKFSFIVRNRKNKIIKSFKGNLLDFKILVPITTDDKLDIDGGKTIDIIISPKTK